MKRIFENIPELTTRKDYDKALLYVKKMIEEASLNGALNNPESDNDYIREIGRIGHLCAAYEDMYMEFEHIKVKKRTPQILEYA